MTETSARDRVADAIASFERRAQAHGRSFEQEVEFVIERGDKFTPEERVAVSRYFRAQHPGLQPSLTLDEIKEGLM